MRDVACLALAHFACQGPITEQDIVLEIDLEAAPDHVGRDDRRHLAVHRQGLGVQQPVPLFENVNPGSQKIFVIASAGRPHDPGVVARREDDGRCNPPTGAGTR